MASIVVFGTEFEGDDQFDHKGKNSAMSYSISSRIWTVFPQIPDGVRLFAAAAALGTGCSLAPLLCSLFKCDDGQIPNSQWGRCEE